MEGPGFNPKHQKDTNFSQVDLDAGQRRVLTRHVESPGSVTSMATVTVNQQNLGRTSGHTCHPGCLQAEAGGSRV